jgi:hypothetical protein
MGSGALTGEMNGLSNLSTSPEEEGRHDQEDQESLDFVREVQTSASQCQPWKLGETGGHTLGSLERQGAPSP